MVDFRLEREGVVAIASPGKHCTHTIEPWLTQCHRQQSMKRGCCCTTAVCTAAVAVVLLLYRCWHCSVYRGCAVTFELPRKYGLRSTFQIEIFMCSFLPGTSYCTTTGIMAYTRTHISNVRGRYKREELDVRLLLYRGCRKVERA